MCKRGILRAANPTVGGIVLSLVLGLPASATSLCDSPIEMIVGRVDDVQPSAAGAHLYRGGGEILIQEGMCLVYGDQITAKPGVIVQIDTTQRTTSIGGRDDPEWKAPVAKTAGGSGGSGVFAGFWDLLRVLQQYRELLPNHAAKNARKHVAPHQGWNVSPHWAAKFSTLVPMLRKSWSDGNPRGRFVARRHIV
jgi:hypothetical protein